MKNIGLPEFFLSYFDLLIIVLDQMDPMVDRQISEHVLCIHRYLSPIDEGRLVVMFESFHVFLYSLCLNEGNLFYFLGSSILDNNSRFEEKNLKDEIPVYVKYNRMLHGRNSNWCKKDMLTI